MHILACLPLGIKLGVCHGVQEVIALFSFIEMFIAVCEVRGDLFERINVFFHVGALDILEVAQEVHPLLLFHVREGVKARVECAESMPTTVGRDIFPIDYLMGSRVVACLIQCVEYLSIDFNIKVWSWSIRRTWSNGAFSGREPSLDAKVREEAGFP